jgi:putative ABC transport system permease protein
MRGTKFIPLVVKQVIRHRTRSALTIASVCVAMFLFCGVQAMQKGAEAVTMDAANDNTLIVYRKDRYCPFTSRMPESYIQRIAATPGVASVLPMKISLSNCRTSLDVVTFRGVPPEQFLALHGNAIQIKSGSFEEWKKRSDATLLGETLASRRGLKVGDRFDAAGVTAYVAGIIHSDEPQHDNVAYAHLSFLQFASGSKSGGFVTQFNVKVTDATRIEEVASAIDAKFAADQEPTHTRSEKAFVAQAAADVLEIVGFTKWLGWACLAAVLALVANAVIMAVHQRIREHAVLQTLGFNSPLVAALIVGEGLVVSLAGGILGTGISLFVLWYGSFNVSVEGLSVPVQYGPGLILTGLAVSIALGVLAGLFPAWQASRRDIVTCLRAM